MAHKKHGPINTANKERGKDQLVADIKPGVIGVNPNTDPKSVSKEQLLQMAINLRQQTRSLKISLVTVRDDLNKSGLANLQLAELITNVLQQTDSNPLFGLVKTQSEPAPPATPTTPADK